MTVKIDCCSIAQKANIVRVPYNASSKTKELFINHPALIKLYMLYIDECSVCHKRRALFIGLNVWNEYIDLDKIKTDKIDFYREHGMDEPERLPSYQKDGIKLNYIPFKHYEPAGKNRQAECFNISSKLRTGLIKECNLIDRASDLELIKKYKIAS